MLHYTPAPSEPIVTHSEDEMATQLKRALFHKTELYGTPGGGLQLANIPLVLNNKQPTWCTDHYKIYINSVFTEGLRIASDVRGLIVHEKFHIDMLHCLRMIELMRRGFDAKIINVAADYIVNGRMRRLAGYGDFITLPGDTLFHDVWSSDDKYTLEHVVEQLSKEQEEPRMPPPPKGPIGQPCDDGDPGEGDGGDNTSNGSDEGHPEEDISEEDGDEDGQGSGQGDQGDEPQDGEGGAQNGQDDQPQDGSGSGNQQGGQSGDQPGPGDIDTGGGCGDIIPIPNVDIDDTQQVQELINEIHDREVRSRIAEKQVGTGAGNSRNVVDNSDLLAKPIPEVQLKKFLTNSAFGDESFARPNKRFVPQNIYLPGVTAVPGEIILCWDSSGSVGEDEQKAFRDTIVTNCAKLRIDKIRICYVDTKIHMNPETNDPWFVIRTNRGSRAKDASFEPQGGGGTTFDPIFNYIEENNERIKGLIYLTDGLANVNAPAPDFPVLWVTTRWAPTFVNQAQWGEIAYI